MYSPSHYRVTDQALINSLIKENPFSTMITIEPELTITHLPFYLHSSSENVFLSAHMAKANSHWIGSEGKEATIIFQGPHAYISPSWYTDHPANVPTWNYMIVHVKGKLRLISEPDLAFERLKQQIEFNEGFQGWSLPNDLSQIDGLLKQIVVFEIQDLHFEAKFKLSQKHDLPNKMNVISRLETRGEVEKSLAKMMRELSLNT